MCYEKREKDYKTKKINNESQRGPQKEYIVEHFNQGKILLMYNFALLMLTIDKNEMFLWNHLTLGFIKKQTNINNSDSI